MRFLNYIFTFFIVLLFCSMLEAQHQAKLNRAERMMGQHNYKHAVDIYLSILEKGNDNNAIIGIAECYRRIGNPDETEYWYGLVSRMPNAPQKSWLYYAQALQRNGKYNEAKKWAEKYVTQIEPNNTQAMWLIKSCEEDVVQDLRASGKLYKVDPVEEINTENDEYSPIFFKNDLVFVSSREHLPQLKNFDRWTTDDEKSFTEIYRIGRNQVGEPEEFIYNYGKPEKFSKSLSTNHHDGPISFNAEFNEIYYTRSNMDKSEDGITRLKVYKSRGAPKKYSDPKSLPFNSDEYSVLHPSLSNDGEQLFFASDMPGGFGGFDLYVSYLEDGRWSPPVNLGPTVNTEGNEVFPFHHHSGTLYFASNGLVGLGGLDIYKTRENYGAWTDPINLGFPINTVDDDFSFIVNSEETHGYFASNRKGQGGDDIYSFTKLSITIEINVFDQDTQMPLEAADVFTPCSEVQNFLTNQNGKVIMELPLDVACDFAAEKLGYQPNSVRLPRSLVPGKRIFLQIPLKMECIFIVSGTIVDGLTNKPVDSALVRLQSYCSGERDEMSMYTDAEGNYEFRDVREDCDIRVTVAKPGFTKGSATFKTGTECGEAAKIAGIVNDSNAYVKGIPLYCFGDNCERLDTVDLGLTETEVTELGEDCIDRVENLPNGDKKTYYCNGTALVEKSGGEVEHIDEDGNVIDKPDEGRAKLVNIYFDFDDARIRSDARKGLDGLVALMLNYPDSKIKITSHTDARGKKGYNNRLSKRRAESVIKYLMKNGIRKARLRAQGMGERVMINNCYDGVECDETQHQENRRTEFIIIENIPQKFGDGKSKVPDNIKTHPCRDCPSAGEVEGEAGNDGDIESSINEN